VNNVTIRQYDPSLHRVSKITTIDRDGHDYHVYTARARAHTYTHTHTQYTCNQFSNQSISGILGLVDQRIIGTRI